jgi:hypothetical protein
MVPLRDSHIAPARGKALPNARHIVDAGLERATGAPDAPGPATPPNTVDYAVAFAVAELVCWRMNAFMRSSARAAYGAFGFPVMNWWSAPS